MTDTNPCERWDREVAGLRTLDTHVEPEYIEQRRQHHRAWCRACGQWTWQPQEHLGRDPEESK